MHEQNIPAEVVAEDRRLDQAARTSQEELARLRWHWTLDESNPERATIDAYARAVGRAPSTVSVYANGYAQAHRDISMTRTLGEHIAMASVGETKRKAAQAIADANGIRVDNVLSNRRQDVRDLVDAAQDAADRRGTTVDDEIARKVEWQQKAKQADADRKQARKARHTLRYLQHEEKISKARRLLSEVLNDSEGVEYTAEERQIIADVIGQLRAVINLIDVRITGAADIDWDAELAKMGDAK